MFILKKITKGLDTYVTNKLKKNYLISNETNY